MPEHRRLLTCLAVVLSCSALSEPVKAQQIPGTQNAGIRTGTGIRAIEQTGFFRNTGATRTDPGIRNAGGVRHLPMAGQGASARHVFTVMGHVRNQQAFELATAAPSLVEVLETFAQGLTETASNNVRIVRRGRVVNTFYRPDSTERLMPGDLVIVDGRSAHGTVFRGGRSRSISTDGVIRIGLIGILPYPVILQLEQAQPVAAAWVTQQLGQSPQAAERARLIVPRRFTRTTASSPLPDCSVIVFDPATIDVSRLPPNLPTPFRPGQPTPPAPDPGRMAASPPRPGSLRKPRPLGQIPVARGLPSPGVATVPRINPPSSAAGTPPPRVLSAPQSNGAAGSGATPPDAALQRDAEERVRDRLTSPSSVPVESVPVDSARRSASTDGNKNRFSERRRSESRRSEPGRVHIGDPSATGRRAETDPGRAVRKNARRSAAGARQDSSELPATKPFESFADESASVGANSADDAPVELPLTPETTGSPETAGSPGAAGTPERAVFPDLAGTSAATGSGGAPASSAAPDLPGAADPAMPFPSPVPSRESGVTMARPDLPSSATAFPEAGRVGHPDAVSGRSSATLPGRSRTPEEQTRPEPSGALAAASRGTVAPRPVPPANWPLMTAAATGGLAVVSILLMMILVARKKLPEPAPVLPGARYWLDRLIRNELPVEDETVTLPSGEQFFGKAAPIQRIDAAHSAVPKPHFLAAGGESGVQRGRAPSPGAPESGQADSPAVATDPAPATRTPQRDRHSDRPSPAMPVRPAARQRLAAGDPSVIDLRAEGVSVPASGPLAAASDRLAAARMKSRQNAGATGSTGISLDIVRLAVADSAAAQPVRASTPVPGPAAAPGPAAPDAPENTASGRHARRTFRIDSGHQKTPADGRRQPPGKPAGAEGQTVSDTEMSPVLPPVDRSIDQAADQSAEPAGQASGATVPRPRLLQRRRPAAVSPSPTSHATGRSDGDSAAAASADVSIRPAPSVADTADLLDRVLSSVHEETRGDR